MRGVTILSQPEKIVPMKGLDASFLYLEELGTPMHVGSLMLLDTKALSAAGHHGDFASILHKHLAARLPKAAVLRRVLDPAVLSHPSWREVEAVDLKRHIVTRRLRAPGTEAALLRLVAELHAEPLPRDRPLWRFVVIEGLRSGLVALYAQIHHALIDGQGGMALAKLLLDVDPKTGEQLRLAALAESKPKAVKPVAKRSALKALGQMLQSLPDWIERVGETAEQVLQLGQSLRDAIRIAPRTPFNVQIGPKRAFAHTWIALAEVKQVARALDASINDIVMAMAGTALREWLLAEHQLPSKSLIAAMPVSLRGAGDTAIENQVSMMQCTLHTEAADPIQRLRLIQKDTLASKRTVSLLRDWMPTNYPGFAAPIWVSGLSRLWARGKLAERLPPLANLVISNVPGPPFTLFLAGARLVATIPVSIVTHGLALNITLHSYDGRLDIGIISARDVVAKPDRLAQLMIEAFAALRLRALLA